MNLEIIHVGLLGTNCYVTWDDNKNCVVVDCGGDAQKVADFINERGFTPTHLLLTHGHGDHMGGAADLKDLFPQIQIVLGEKDLEMIGDGEKSMSNAVAPYARPFVPDILGRHLHQKQRALLRGHPVPGQHGPHRPVWGRRCRDVSVAQAPGFAAGLLQGLSGPRQRDQSRRRKAGQPLPAPGNRNGVKLLKSKKVYSFS